MPNSEKTNQRNQLKIRLEELHNQLVKSSHISAADRDLMGKMAMGILQLEDVQQPYAEAVDEQGLRDTLEQKSLEYEAQHPKLAFTLRQILDILTRMGI
ncbi:DUF4404 family protein [Porticoccaceae bacterium]|nr:DUF4404 family protein [Porticoccaceae bacterium]MDB9805598.1 DUF4404 family protein [Porticoccaceae bacterium]MDB9992892.1 DUF4404 family protein [Porticoccaceae bacterium]